MSRETLEGRCYITTACGPHQDGKPCETCWPCSRDHSFRDGGGDA